MTVAEIKAFLADKADDLEIRITTKEPQYTLNVVLKEPIIEPVSVESVTP